MKCPVKFIKPTWPQHLSGGWERSHCYTGHSCDTGHSCHSGHSCTWPQQLTKRGELYYLYIHMYTYSVDILEILRVTATKQWMNKVFPVTSPVQKAYPLLNKLWDPRLHGPKQNNAALPLSRTGEAQRIGNGDMPPCRFPNAIFKRLPWR